MCKLPTAECVILSVCHFGQTTTADAHQQSWLLQMKDGDFLQFTIPSASVPNYRKATAYYLVISHQHGMIFFSGLWTHTLQDLRVRQLGHCDPTLCILSSGELFELSKKIYFDL